MPAANRHLSWFKGARRRAWQASLLGAFVLAATPDLAHAQPADPPLPDVPAGQLKVKKPKKPAEAKAKAKPKAKPEAKAPKAEKAKKPKETGPVAPAAPTEAPKSPRAPGALPTPVPTAPPATSAVPELKPFETGIDYQPTSPNAQVTFNLEDAGLTDLVRLISQITGKRFILPGTTRAIKATVYAPTKVSAGEAYQAFLSILELNGMAIVPAGRYLKIVESGRVEGRAIPLYTGDEGVPEGDRFVTRLQRVNYISADDAAKLLERFKSGDGSLTAYAPTNMLIVTDTGTNLNRMLRILDVIDVARTGEQVWVEPIHHANASEIAARLTEIFEPNASSASGGGGNAAAAAARGRGGKGAAPAAAGAAGTTTIGASSGESRLTKIIADERTNALVIVATEPAYMRILEMLKYLDASLEGEGRIHVHHLQHTDAEEIAGTLQSLVSGRAASGKGGDKAAAGGGGGGDSVFEGKVAVTAHKGSNALVITSSTHDYAALRNVIDTLDSERRQVFIEAVIMELSVKRSNDFGIGFHTGIPDFPGEDSNSVLGFNAGKTILGLKSLAGDGQSLTGLAVGVQGPIIENSKTLVGFDLPGFGVAINALAASGDANILSTPHLIATDNVEAEISVGENVALQTSAFGGGGNPANLLAALGGGGGANALGGLGGLGGALGALGGFGGGALPRQDVGTTVTITPHVNDSDEIRLEISEEISSAGPPSSSGQGARDIARTKAKTEVVVRDQQTVVIGGLMRDEMQTSATKVPVLGDIPLIGALFRSSSKQKLKKNLLLFLTPYIIRSPADLRSIYERKMRERQEFMDRYFVFGDSDYEPPMDYSRTRGLVSEILLELKGLDEKRQLLSDAAMKPVLTHDAKAPVGNAPDLPSQGDIVIEPEGGAVEGAAPASPPGDVQVIPPSAPEGMPVPEAAPVPAPEFQQVPEGAE